MGCHAGLRRLVIVWHDRQDGVGARGLGVLAQLDGMGGGVGAGTRDHRHAAARHVDRDAHQDVMLGRAQRRRFAGGAADDQSGCAGSDLQIAEVFEGGAVHVPWSVNGVGRAGA